MSDIKFDDTVTLESMFGDVEIYYIRGEFFFDGKNYPSKYLAKISHDQKDNPYNGWLGNGVTRGLALAELFTKISERHAADLQRSIYE